MLGILFEEKTLNEMDIQEYINLLTVDSLFSAFEIGFDEETVDGKSLRVLEKSGFPMSFHLPYHVKGKPYDASCFSLDPDGLKQVTTRFIEFSKALGTIENPMIVAHLSKNKNHESNLRYVDFILNLFEKLDYKATLALENLYDSEVIYPCSEIETYLKYFNSNDLTLCLDIPNHHLSNGNDILSVPGHMHFHGFNGTMRHTGLNEFSLSIFENYRNQFKDTTAVFELLYHPDYFKILSESSGLLQK